MEGSATLDGGEPAATIVGPARGAAWRPGDVSTGTRESMSSALIWPAVTLALGLLLLVAEVFVPSGGLLGLSAGVFVCAAVWLAFADSMQAGLLMLGVVAVALPATLAAAAAAWPRTPMGRWLMLKPPDPDEVEPAPSVRHGTRLEHLVGQYGRSLTPLRPSGTVEIDGRRFDGLAEEGMIPAGAIVRALRVRGGQVVVRVAEGEAIDELLTESESG